MKRLLDTNAVSALMKGDPPAIARLAAAESGDVAIPQPVVAQIEFGLARLPPSKRRQALRARFDLILSEIARAEWTDDVSEAYGRIQAALEKRGQRIEDLDAAIAAHALAVEGVLVTSNTRHFARIAGLRVEDWLS